MGSYEKIFKAYDIRGIVPDELDEQVAESVGAAFVRLASAPSVLTVHDMRTSSRPLAEAFARGAASQGADVIEGGLGSTDMLYYASGSLGMPGVMITASHNPAKYNGIKLCREGARPVGADTGLTQLRDAAAQGLPPFHGTPGVIVQRDLLSGYASHLRKLVNLSAIRPLTVAVDAGNGMAGHTVPKVFEGLPITVVPLYFELDGTFPNHEANPIEPANLRDLQRAVIDAGADIGLAFDGDADRCFVVDERGRLVSPSVLTALIAVRELAREPGATVIHNLITSARSPRSSPSTAGPRWAPGSGTRSSRRGTPRPARCSAGSTRATSTSATSGSPTRGCSRRCTCWPRSASGTPPCPRSWPVSAGTWPLARSTARCRTRPRRPSGSARSSGRPASPPTSSTG